MNKRRAIVVGFSFLMVLLGLVGTVRAESQLDFELKNKTGWKIRKIYIGPSSSQEWGKNVIKGGLENGESAFITFSCHASAKKWDLKIIWEDGGESVEWHGYKLAEISKITLHYDAKKDLTTANVE